MSQQLLAIPFPQMGVSVDAGTVLSWLKQPGDAVAADEVVCEISTDKVDTEVYAPAAGVIAEILVAAGETVAVGTPLAMLASDAGEAGAPDAGVVGPPDAAVVGPPAPTPEQPAAAGPTNGVIASTNGAPPPVAIAVAAPSLDITTAPAELDYEVEAEAAVSAPGADGVLCSPVARRIAEEHNVPLSSVTGSGRRGRIRKADVLAALVAAPSDPSTPSAPSTPSDPPPRSEPVTPPEPSVSVAASLPADAVPRGYEDVPFTVVPTSPVRRAIAEHMRRSRDTAAHMTTEVEVDMHRVTEVRAALNRERLAADMPKLSFLPFIARAACAVLRDYPDLNATFEDTRLIRWEQVNLGIAVDTDRGLLAPVIRGCERLTVSAIAEQIAGLAQRARSRTLTPDDMRAGTFTLSNPGSVGAVSAHAIINQPQVAILGTPAIVKRPTVIPAADGTDVIAVRPIMLLALTFDHRAVDGAEATRCVVAIKQLLEGWDSTVLA
jgi:pyruvate dehydrogenase E2 component (dihydrolipoamide acetyltransferase)